MIRLRFVGDGERDAVTVPEFVKGVLRSGFVHGTLAWSSLRVHGEKKIKGYRLRGYGAKLLYVLVQARSAQDGYDGVVATVDTDKAERGEKLKHMKLAREAHQSKYARVPAALGEATPHGEAWLLDDAVAVREALGLPADVPVTDAGTCAYPKAALEELHGLSPRAGERPLDVWPDIAARVDPRRCNHAATTGFGAFVEEVRAELGPVFASAG